MARKSAKVRSVQQSRKKKNRAEKRARHLNRSVAAVSSPPNALDVLISESFSQLDLPEGPFSRLPNELVQSILVRVDMQNLIHLQVVCKKWQAVIYSIGHKMKLLYFTQSRYYNQDNYNFDFHKKRSFGQIDLNAFTTIKCKLNITEHSHSQLIELFANITSIALNLPLSDIVTVLSQLPLNQLTTLVITDSIFFYIYRFVILDTNDLDFKYTKLLTLINSCDLLKRLDIQFPIDSEISIIEPTFARLELFSCGDFVPSLVGYFGPNCTRVSLERFGESVNFYQWHNINEQWLANVTHLDLQFVYQFDRVIEYLSEHAVSLQVLHLEASLGNSTNTRMSSQMISHLAKLKHLTELEMDWIFFDFPQLDAARRDLKLARLVFMCTCTLSITKMIYFPHPEMDKMESGLLASVLSTILPNVEHLNIAICNSNGAIVFHIMQGFESFLNLFPKLQTYTYN